MTGSIYISVDMEGVAGVSRLHNVVPGHRTYARGQELMTAEANAAVAGAFDAGATRVVVADSHGPMDNILPARLDPRARLINGSPRTCGMVHGLDGDFDAALFIGYHAAAGASGVLSHTFTGFWTELRLNGRAVSEADVNALYAGRFGVPVKLITGDDRTCSAGIAGVEGVHRVEVKRHLSYTSAEALSPTTAGARIREGAARAVADSSIRPAIVPPALEVEIDLKLSASADLVAMVATAERTSEYTVRIRCADVEEIYAFIGVAGALAAHVVATQASAAP
ncbi:M55 family metallopeptidase [Embleya hyalina]|uniref:Peptide ABC transporter substrate-binding protein n=1 Tax=Embleya hyalina TaxID=516124 RepID=A0A401Z161_9ACTN|nr:M55 family metallopeptidase [Embleya hyalina]GCE00653.1 peptide ABC transporter substrate-binding protein [Embleya hyalina]